MSTFMTQDSLTKWLTGRGWEIQSTPNLVKDFRKGISIWALSPTGYTLSIQGGGGSYSEPGYYTDEYISVEFAIWKSQKNGDKEGPYIKDVIITSGDSVEGLADFDKVVMAVHIIEDWKNGRGPQTIMQRDDPEWDMRE